MYNGPWYECQGPDAKYVRESQFAKYKKKQIQMRDLQKI